MAKDKVWIIVDDAGCAYIDHRLTRQDMIAKHVHDLMSFRDGFGELSPFAFGGSLTPDQQRAWKILRRGGDRCVRATLSYLGEI